MPLWSPNFHPMTNMLDQTAKKKEKLLLKDKSFIKEVVRELDSSTASASASANSNGKDAFFKQAGLALAVYCKSQEHQQDIHFLSMMTSPNKKKSLT
jgi:hypothetical protein